MNHQWRNHFVSNPLPAIKNCAKVGILMATIAVVAVLAVWLASSTTAPREPSLNGRPLSRFLNHGWNSWPDEWAQLNHRVDRGELEAYLGHTLRSRDSIVYAALHRRLPQIIQQRLPSPARPSELQFGAVRLLGTLKLPTENQLKLLTRSLTHESEHLRVFACQELIRIIEQPSEEPAARKRMFVPTIPALTQYAGATTNAIAQYQAVKALIILEANLKPVSPLIQQMLGRADDAQKNLGLLAAWRLEPNSESFSAVRNQLIPPANNRARSLMALVIGQLGPMGGPFREWLEQNTHDTDYGVRKTATNALARIEGRMPPPR
jgi:hypothetical protein